MATTLEDMTYKQLIAWVSKYWQKMDSTRKKAAIDLLEAKHG